MGTHPIFESDFDCLTEMSKIPKVFVFDLDGCVWEPEMYELWGSGSPFTLNRKNGNLKDSRNTDVYLLGAVREILYELKTNEKYANSIVAIASTRDEPNWARECLDKFKIGPNLDITLGTVFSHSEIYKSSIGKKKHFQEIKTKTGVDFDEMVFYDNQMNNMNCVSKLGVTCVYTPDGVTAKMWQKSLEDFPMPGKIIR